MPQDNIDYRNRPDTWKQAARGELSSGEYEEFLDSLSMREYVDFERDKENRLGEKEEYLDGIISHMSELKMDGKPLGNEQLLGDNLTKGSELFQLQEFSPQVQTDILVSLAYFRTPEFEKRTAQSLGYDTPEMITGKDREVYDNIIHRGKEAYQHLKFEDSGSLIGSHTEMDTYGTVIVRVPVDNPDSKDLGVASHETAHYVYNSFAPDAVNPGIYHQGEGESLEPSKHYGKDGSPYDRINESNTDPTRVSARMEELDTDYMKEGHRVDDYLKHDNMGYERAADVHGARMTMLREGIWNPFGDEPLTEKHVEEFRQRHPDSRIFDYWNNQEATQNINTIAQNDNGQPSVDRESLLEELRQQVKENVKNTLAEIPKAGADTQNLNTEQSAEVTKSFEKDNLTNEMALLASTKFDIAYESMEAEQQQQQQQHSFGMHV